MEISKTELQQLLEKLPLLKKEIQKVLVGQDVILDEILVAMLAGHCLLEGVPGLAKTLMVRTLSQALHLTFKRIQFTPDLMPTDILGTEILEEDHSSGRRFFKFNQGPIFANIVLADDINRTPPKTQSALLEAMREFEITYGGKTYPLDRPFFILATQNPIEQAGTYPLPEAQLDRFLIYVKIGYPSAKEEVEILSSTTNEQKYFGSTDGSYTDQDVHRIWPTFTVTKTDKKTGKFETRNSLSAPTGMGYEYLSPGEEDKINGLFTLYRNRYDMLEDVKTATRHVDEKLKAKPVEPGKYDLVLDPSHLFLTIHESVGHPTELDRVLGYEANYAGTSFVTIDKWATKKFNFGNECVNFIADKTQPHSLGAVGYDDEGVKTREWDIIKDGILVSYQTTRDQAHIIGLNESQECSYADNWGSIQFQRMPNVSLQPRRSPMKPSDMVKNIEKGLYMLGRNSYSIDQQRYNFQFSAQLCYEIKNGEITGLVKDAAYQANTQEFWNSCAAICDKDDYRLGGSFFDGKGQPSQVSAVSYGCATTRFNGVNVINTGRKI